MATNIDFQNAGNDYQNTAWNWYASMVLHQADGTLDLTKTDKKTGEIIGDDAGEGQTSFYLWKYETDKQTGDKDTMYCTYVEPPTPPTRMANRCWRRTASTAGSSTTPPRTS